MPTETHTHKTLSVAEVDTLVDLHFPQIHAAGRFIAIEDIGYRSARLRLKANDTIIRPGGTISGPAMFTLADFGIYATLLGEMGEAALQAVTSNLNITFLARPEPRDLIANIEILRLGRRQAVAEVKMRSDGSDVLVAHAIATYAMPAKR